uniref:Tricorn protease homolog n=1 Tax=candidate division WOR-3 bacterium TaxID=2052148 RepID=A0A7C4XDQ0_UNCW3
MPGYYRFPSLNKDTIVFVCEDDLWLVSVNGGLAHRLTSNLGRISHCSISPDGEYIAFTGREEGNNEVYCISIKGGTARRLTFLGANTIVRGWTRDGNRILFASDTGQWYPNFTFIYTVDKNKDIPELVPVGPARTISYSTKRGVVIGRNTADPSRWKRYRGGTVGEIWIDPEENGKFRKLLDVKGNLADPMWINSRIYFISDHEGVGNIYSCTIAGKDLKRHTHHTEFYVRNAKTDGRNIVYHCGGDIYVLFPEENRVKKIEIDFRSPRVQTQRKFVEAKKYLEDYAIHPRGEKVCITTRGKVFSMPNWEGPVIQNGLKNTARYRLGRWLYDGKKLVVVTDEKGEDSLQIHQSDGSAVVNLPVLDIGRPIRLEPSPREPLVALTNHRNELILVNLKSKKRYILDRSKFRRIGDIAWSPDGIWIAYSFADSERTSCIKIANVIEKKTYQATKSVLYDFAPSFDPAGKYLYFLSARHFDPVYDTMQFELSFPSNIKPYLILLNKDLTTPFRYTKSVPAPLDGITESNKVTEKPKKLLKKIKIDLEGITERVIPFPLPPGNYTQIWGIKDRVLFTTFPIIGGKAEWFSDEPRSDGTLKFFDFKDQKDGIVVDNVTNFKVSQDGEVLIYCSKNQLRIIKPVEKADQKLTKEPPGPKSGWLDLSRIKVLVEPKTEWQQMYRDAWRLQRDHFWTKNMSGIDWNGVYKKYLPLLDRIGTRSELSDLIWEMQGELGTSHAYEWGGDYREEPKYSQGFLGADLKYDKKRNAYRIAKIITGDPWEPNATSPLSAPGLNIKEGDLLLKINGIKLNKKTQPNELLVNRAGSEIAITVARGKNKRTFTIKTLTDETPARYREWVEANRELVHQLGKNRIGYVHIPDMGPWGFGEFHRYFLSEIKYPGLIVDVRFNRGGHVSQLILEKVARRRIGYDITRWGQPAPYPYESVLGPIVAITNEYAGSDGDIFSHGFKLYKIGPLVGKRTWGGVIGISPYYRLSDGGLTTQPEYSFWFIDVGWGVENYGTEPDIEVEITPQDYLKGRDTQLLRAVDECLKLIKKTKPKIPDFGKKPNLKLLKKI